MTRGPPNKGMAEAKNAFHDAEKGAESVTLAATEASGRIGSVAARTVHVRDAAEEETQVPPVCKHSSSLRKHR